MNPTDNVLELIKETITTRTQLIEKIIEHYLFELTTSDELLLDLKFKLPKNIFIFLYE